MNATMITLSTTLIVLLAFRASCAGVAAAETAEALLAAQRAGVGSPAALDALGVVRSTGTVTFQGFPSVGSFTEIVDAKGRSRLEARFEGIPPAVNCTNGELTWMTGTGGVEIKTGWAAAADARLFGRARHRDWRDLYAKCEIAGDATIDGRACREIALVPKPPEALGLARVPGEEAPAPDAAWLDRGTNELVRFALWQTVSGAGWQRVVLDFADWRTVAGVRFPFKSRLTFGPAEHPLVIEMEVAKLETNVALDGDPFQPSDEVFAELGKRQSLAAGADPAFEVKPHSETHAATVRVKCPKTKLSEQLATILPEVMAAVQRERLTPNGGPFVRYHSFGEAEIDLEAGIPVTAAFEAKGRIRCSSLPQATVVTGFHVGPYQNLPTTHAALARFLAREGLVSDGGPWEIYWTDPGLERDPSKWRTEIVQPVTAASAEKRRERQKSAAPAAAADEGAGGPGGAAAGPPADMRPFDALVGAWDVIGGPGAPSGRVRFEWLPGGHFLAQHVDLVEGGRRVRSLEVIGHDRPFGATTASPDITSTCYDADGNTIRFTWEFDGRALTIWGGAKGSAMKYEGRLSDDGSTLVGGWKWPGGGFETVTKRVAGGK